MSNKPRVEEILDDLFESWDAHGELIAEVREQEQRDRERDQRIIEEQHRRNTSFDEKVREHIGEHLLSNSGVV